jgi:ABC-type bacteriocin/lantibiotic exporter with double-glycine peptidase domain
MNVKLKATLYATGLVSTIFTMVFGICAMLNFISPMLLQLAYLVVLVYLAGSLIYTLVLERLTRDTTTPATTTTTETTVENK